jgi:hypothetical protein
MQSPMESQDALIGREAELDAVEVTAKLFDAQGRAIPNTLVDLRPVSGSSTVKRKIDTGTTTAPGSTGFNQAGPWAHRERRRTRSRSPTSPPRP